VVRGPIVLPSLAHFRCAGLQQGSLPARTFGKRGYLILDLYQRLWPDTLIQADEIRAKGRKLIIWIALAMDVTTRLWMAGVVSTSRDRRLIDRLFQHVRACCQFVPALLVCTDGFAAYPNSIVRAFREKVKKKAGRGRCCLEAWPDLCIATVIKRTEKKRVVEVTRKITRGTLTKAQELLQRTVGCQEFNTSFIERLNATMRERLASLTRKCRHAGKPRGNVRSGNVFNWM
jgi:IS1 family transposase